MRDFNFFRPYLKRSRKSTKKRKALYLFTSVIAIVLIVAPIVNQLMIKRMEEQTIKVSTIVDSYEALKARERITNKQHQVQGLKDYYSTLESIENEMKKADMINDLFLQTITDRIPVDVFFKSINIDQNSIQITGIGKDRVSVAEFEKNLRQLSDFDNVFISNITKDRSGYSFTIFFKIKGGIDDEAN